MTRTALLVLAAGLGSRYGGCKQIEKVGAAGESTLEYSLYDARLAGFDEFVFLIRASIEAEFREFVLSRLPKSFHCRIAFQEMDSLLGPEHGAIAAARAKPWGTGHALLCAEATLGSPFAVVNADDFYGRGSFRAAHDFLAASTSGSAEWCMVGFSLRNTTSRNGPVSRGICDVVGDRLSSIAEHRIIQDRGGSFVSVQPDGSEVSLRGDQIVSMNLWGFTASVFELAKPLFQSFLREEGESPKAEFGLPSIVDRLVSEKKAKVSVLPTAEAWFGLTHREDRAEVMARIAALTASGFYPTPLWGAS